MPKCTSVLDYDSQMTPIDPCEYEGSPDLDGLCSLHFSEFVIRPLQAKMDEATVKWSDALTRRYKYELSLGLRAGPDTWEDDLRAATKAHGSRPYTKLAASRRVDSAYGSNKYRPSIIIEDDETEQNI